MAKFGFMQRALAGMGQGMAAAGQMSLQAQQSGDLEKIKAEVQANRDRILNGYQTLRDQAEIGSREKIAGEHNDTQIDIADSHNDTQLEIANLGLMGRENKIEYKDGVVFKNGAVDQDMSAAAGELAKKYGPKKVPELLQNMQGLVDAKVAPDLSAAFLKLHPDKEPDKNTEQMNKEVGQFQHMVDGRFGIGFREKLNPAERGQYDALISRGTDLIYNNAKAGNAFGTLVDEFNRLGARAGGSGELSPAVKSARERFSWGTP